MKKDEILLKSRAEGKDEMVLAVNNRAYYWGTIALLVACLFFVCIGLFYEERFLYEIPAILFAFNTGKYFYIFIRLKSKKDLFLAGLCFFVLIATTILYFLNR